MSYRTKIYIAADWTGDKNAVEQLRKWNDNNYWSLSFPDAHDLTQSSDKSLNCSIKKSLAKRLDISKTFVLIVGANTRSIRSGSCQYCSIYNDCGNTSNRSYINYECYKAVHDGLNIIVLYNSVNVDKSKCPDIVRDTGKHIPMRFYKGDKCYWDYGKVKEALQ